MYYKLKSNGLIKKAHNERSLEEISDKVLRSLLSKLIIGIINSLRLLALTINFLLSVL